MARIVLTCWGSYGDLFPYLGLARELRARGHIPVVATCPFYRDLVEAEGLRFQPLRPDVDPKDSALLARVMDPVRGPEVVIKEIVVGHLDESYADVTEAARGAELVISHPATCATPVVCAEQQLPWISTVLSPASFFSVYDFPAVGPRVELAVLTRHSTWAARAFLAVARRATRSWMAPVEALRAARGLPSAGHPLFEGQFSPMGTLALFSNALARPQRDWPPHAEVTGFVWYNRAIPMPDALAAFLDRGEPPIVFTLGSSAVGAPGTFYDESVRAATMLGRRAVFLVGKYAPALSQSQLPDSMLAVDVAPHDALFPRAAAIVHHGGVGTTGQALRSGRPMLVVPHSHDQPDNGARLSRLGCGRMLDARKYTAERAAAQLRILLGQPSYRQRAEAVGVEVRGENGTATACDAIERAAAGKTVKITVKA